MKAHFPPVPCPLKAQEEIGHMHLHDPSGLAGWRGTSVCLKQRTNSKGRRWWREEAAGMAAERAAPVNKAVIFRFLKFVIVRTPNFIPNSPEHHLINKVSLIFNMLSQKCGTLRSLYHTCFDPSGQYKYTSNHHAPLPYSNISSPKTKSDWFQLKNPSILHV